MGSKIEINIKDLVNDIRAKRDCCQLMEKYNLSLFGMIKALSGILRAKAMESEELGRLLPLEAQVVEIREQRKKPRHSIRGTVLVHDVCNPVREGLMQNVTEEGFQVKGIPACTGETKKLVVKTKDFLPIGKFALEAECRWFTLDSHPGGTTSGYRIKILSDRARTELRKLVFAESLEENETSSAALANENRQHFVEASFWLESNIGHGTGLNNEIIDCQSLEMGMGVDLLSSAMNAFAIPCLLVDEYYRIISVNEFCSQIGPNKNRLEGQLIMSLFPDSFDRVKSCIDRSSLDKNAITISTWMEVLERRRFVKAIFRPIRCGMENLTTVTLQDFALSRQKTGSTESTTNELFSAYRELLSQLANNEVILHKRSKAMQLIMESLGTRLKEERQQLTLELISHLKPMVSRIKSETLSTRGEALVISLEMFLEQLLSNSDNRAVQLYSSLTPRESEICNLILAGKSSKEITDVLGLSLETVSTHRRNIRKKLGLLSGQSIFNALRAR
ncbi:helix-turn-helix transcriptional regulator [Desulfomonile tiedjei]|uniref:Response regulator containing a CheY-like receiver domain and an HTH DNA-binding domain n=1 Tax=Desulfomonile tiedjei (strain ATCC 49306 / DSM 6799 / DCB-1) TaxID=706587 RepID=I4CC98_DESTA|nr:LuxR C-terminal-related transcriptional regulator [Desulfomonile tiedjei]AFM27189.1 response regulator containing a CheY-like receiver domain and an HTH DNA-binding domain [Desulfomonile tiedjei DSM 6799]